MDESSLSMGSPHTGVTGGVRRPACFSGILGDLQYTDCSTPQRLKPGDCTSPDAKKGRCRVEYHPKPDSKGIRVEGPRT